MASKSRVGSLSQRAVEERSLYGAASGDRRFRKNRHTSATGSSGDSHLGGNAFLRVMEYARAIDRDDPILGSMLDKAELNTIQNGFPLDFDTGDVTLDEELFGGWNEWATTPELCDLAGEQTFADMEATVFRGALCDGDYWGILLDSGHIELMEGHRLLTPAGKQQADPITGRRVVNGVEIDSFRKQHGIWLTKDDMGTGWQSAEASKMVRRDVRDDDGVRVCLQFFAGPKRATLTRGISVYQKLFDLSGMHDDAQFAALLKSQVLNSLILVEEQLQNDGGAPPTPLGPINEVTEVSSPNVPGVTTEVVEGVGPATVLRPVAGRKLTPFVNTAPGPDYDRHIRMILTFMGVNLGIPLIVALMDGSETNFSGWRGAFDQAKLGFIRNQNRLLRRWHNPVLAWHLAARRRKNSRLDAIMARIVEKARASGRQWYKWHLPTWPYINPREDAEAAMISVANYQEAPSTNMATRGLDYDREMRRGIEDRGRAIEWAIAEAVRINKAHKPEQPVQWSDLYTPLAPKHVQLSISEKRGEDPAGQGKQQGATP